MRCTFQEKFVFAILSRNDVDFVETNFSNFLLSNFLCFRFSLNNSRSIVVVEAPISINVQIFQSVLHLFPVVVERRSRIKRTSGVNPTWLVSEPFRSGHFIYLVAHYIFNLSFHFINSAVQSFFWNFGLSILTI